MQVNEKCIGCGICADSCGFEAISIIDLYTIYNHDRGNIICPGFSWLNNTCRIWCFYDSFNPTTAKSSDSSRLELILSHFITRFSQVRMVSSSSSRDNI